MPASSVRPRRETPQHAHIPRMIYLRPWLLLFVAGLLLEGLAQAQDNAGGTGASPAPAPGGASPGGAGAGPGTGGASSSFGSSAAPGTTPTTPATPAAGAAGAGTPLPPGTNTTPNNGAASTLPGTANPSTNGGPDNSAAGGSASSFGTDQGPTGPQLRQAPASFTVPGFYGRGQQQFTVGEGRLARPHFRISGNISTGYDDNVFQTPTHPASSPAQKVNVPITPAVPTVTVEEFVPSGDPNVPGSVQPVTIPGTPEKFKTVTIPAVPAPQRQGSWVTRTDAKWDVQLASRKTLFTFDLGGGLDYYWDRPGKKEDYTGSLSMVYLRKLTGRTQFTFSVDSSYQSQPDFSQPNLPTSNNVGSYLSTNVKADLSYRLTPRFSAVTSVSYNALTYEEQAQGGSNYANTTFGTELRYLFSPRLTLLGELRYSSDMHENQNDLNTTSYYLLVGGELTLSRRFSASLRVGEAVQTFSEGGSKNSAPYLEATLNYRLSYATAISWNGRYGYEEASAPGSQNLVARSGLQLTQIFSPRFQGTLGVNLVHTDNKSAPIGTDTSTSTATTTSTAATSTASLLSTDSIQDTVDASLGFYYTLDRHWSFNLTYSYTMVVGPESTFDYYHQRIFLGAAYQF
jgi:hypothetical protein